MARTALVTGGTRGIGEGIAVALKERGYNVISNYLGNDERARNFELNHGIKTCKFDVSDIESTGFHVEKIIEQHGPIDVLVNNAGITRDCRFTQLDQQDWQQVIDTNLGGIFNTCRILFPKMQDQGFGRIINVSSVNGLAGQYGQANYAASKSGMVGFTKTLAIEGARFGITANVIAPGYVDTEMLRSVPEKVMTKIIGNIPVGRLADVDEIARGVTFLADDRAGFITGSTLSINGGQYFQ